jgi:hypothetical protein
MRRMIALFSLGLAFTPAHAEGPQATPKTAQPLPALGSDQSLEPQVTIVKRGPTTVEEYRIHGHLYMLKITPAHGKPYYLIDEHGDGRFVRRGNLDSGVRVPQWVLFEF